MFAKFVAAKPEGRKTALGEFFLNFSILTFSGSPYIAQVKNILLYTPLYKPDLSCSPAKLNVVVNNLATVMNTILLLPYPLRILLGPLPIEVILLAS